jgi:uncharacterized RDD family membrane protein YckC
MAKRKKRGGVSGGENAGQLGSGRAEPPKPLELAPEGRPEEAGIVGREGDRDALPKQVEGGVPSAGRKRARRGVRDEAQVERRPEPREPAHESGVLGGAEAVSDANRAEVSKSLGDGLGPGPLAGVNQRSEVHPQDAPVDVGEIAGGNRALVAAQAEADRPGPGMAGGEVEDAVRGLGPPLPHAVVEDANRPEAGPLVSREDALHRRGDAGPREPEPLHEGGRNVDLRVHDALAAEPAHEVSGEKGVVLRSAKLEADVAVEVEKVPETAEGAARKEIVSRRESSGPVPARERDEGGGRDRALEVDVKLGLPSRGETGEEAARLHPPRSYGSARPAPLARGALWRRVGAFALDLLVFVGIPFLATTVLVFLALLFSKGEETALALVFHVAQGVAVLGFLGRDSNGSSPGKRMLALRTVHSDGSPATTLDSVVRNVFLFLPILNLLEALEVWRRPDGRRFGDRASGTWVTEA